MKFKIRTLEILGFVLLCFSVNAEIKEIEKKTAKLHHSIKQLTKLAETMKHLEASFPSFQEKDAPQERFLEGKFMDLPIYSEDLELIPNEIKARFLKDNKDFERQKVDKLPKLTGVSLTESDKQNDRNLMIEEKTDEHGDDAMFQHRFEEIDGNYKEEVNKALENIHSSINNMNEEKHIMKGMMENQLDRKLDFLYYDFVRISHRIDETQAYLVTLMNNIDKHYDDKEFYDLLNHNGEATDLQKKGADFRK